MKKLVFQQNGKIYLDSGMNETFFAKSRMAERLEEKGFLAEKISGSWKFTPWNFTGTQLTSDVLPLDQEMPAAKRAALDTVLFEGEAFSGCTLKDYLDADEGALKSEQKTLPVYACAKAVTVLEEAVEQNVKLYQTGAAGIFLSEDFTKVIFLPPALFDQSASISGQEEYAKNQGFFINQNLNGPAGLNFLQSVITYRILTGRYPFSEINPFNRHEDYLDHNFIPLKNSIWGLDKDLSAFVDNALMRRQKNNSVNGKSSKGAKRSIQETFAAQIREDNKAGKSSEEIKDLTSFVLKFPLEAFYRELGLTSEGNLQPGDNLATVTRKAQISQIQFEEKAQKEYKSFNARLRNKRFFRKHKTVFSILFIALTVITAFSLSMHASNMKKPTTMGLTSIETIEMFLGGYNRLDVVAVQSSSKGHDARMLEDTISSFYVASKQRSIYSPQDTTVTPAEWILYNRNLAYSMNGLTQLYIDNIKGRLYFEGPAKNTRPQPLTVEDGTLLQKGEEREHIVQYYVLFNDGPETLHIGKHRDNIKLTYDGKKWIVTQFQTNVELEEINLNEFKEDYAAALEKCQGDFLQTVQLLAEKYPFVNSKSEILEAQNYVKANTYFLKEEEQ